jgi:hypothetical protein
VINSLLIVVAQFVGLSVLGLAALSALPSRGRELLLPAAPVFGAALLAVVMSTTSRFWSALWGLLATVVVAAAIVLLAVYRGRRPWAFSRPSVRTAALAWLVCTPGLLVALVPSWIVGDNLALMPNGNHDSYYYAAESAWLHDNSISPGPDFSGNPGEGNATPAYGPMLKSLDHALRVGQPMVHAALDTAMGTQSVQTVTPLIALWAFLVGPAAFVAARLLRARFGAALAAATLSTSSAILLQQTHQQNMDSLLGASLALLSIATVLAALRAPSQRDEETPPDPSAGEAFSVGVWPAVVTVAALVAVYTEYSLFVAPTILGAVFLGRWRGLGSRLGRGAIIGLLAVLAAPGAWLIAVRGLSEDHGGPIVGSPFFSDGVFYALVRALGVTPNGGMTDSTKLLAALTLVVTFLGLATLIGVVASIVRGAHRGAWIGLLVVAVPYLLRLTFAHLGYGQSRAISVVMPIVILVAVLGWSDLYPRVRAFLTRTRLSPVRIDRALVAASVLAVIATAAVNLNAVSVAVDPPLVRKLHYDGTYAQALTWAEAHGDQDGRAVSVVNPDLTSQMWLAYTLRHLPLVSYPRLRFDYLERTEFWAGEIDPYYIVGAGAVYAGGDVLEKNERFTFVDFSVHRGVVAFPNDQMGWWPDAKPDGAMNGPDRARVLVLANHLAPGQQVVLTIRTDRDNAPVSAVVDDREVAKSKVTGGIGKLTVPVDEDGATIVLIDLSSDGAITPGSLDLVGIDLASDTPLSSTDQGR